MSVCTVRICCRFSVEINLLGMIFSQILSFLNSLTLFSDGSLPPVAEKSLKGLGKGSGGEPFSKRVSPSCSTSIPPQILISRSTHFKKTQRRAIISPALFASFVLSYNSIVMHSFSPLSCAYILPPICSTSVRAIESPSPVEFLPTSTV